MLLVIFAICGSMSLSESRLASGNNNRNKCPECCSCQQGSTVLHLQCACVPEIIPDNTAHFSLHELENFQNVLQFNHFSWRNVTSLHLEVNGHKRSSTLTRETFLGVPNLQVLHLSNFTSLISFPRGIFENLDRLKELDLSRNLQLPLKNVADIFPELQNTTLELVNLSRTNTDYDGMIIRHLEVRSMEKISKLKVKTLDLSWSGLIFFDFQGTENYESLSLRFPILETLNISHTFIATSNEYSIVNNLGNYRFDILAPRLKHLVYEGFNMGVPQGKMNTICGYGSSHCISKTLCCDDHFTLPPFLESVNLDGNKVMEGHCVERPPFNTFCFNRNNGLKSMSFRNAGITGWNLMFVYSDTLHTLDLRHNKIEVVTGVSFRYLGNLKDLLLGSNRLWKYQNDALFETFLNHCTNLQKIDLSKNRLSSIPRCLFCENRRLKTVDLSGNQLNTLSFAISHLTYLEILDISHNSILTIDEFTLHSIGILASNNSAPFINLTKNEFKCSCETKQFVETLHDISKFLIGYESYECAHQEDVAKVQSIDVSTLNGECIFKTLYLVLPVLLPVIFILICSFVLYRKRIYLLKIYVMCHFWKYRTRLENIEDRIFLAYSHHDKDLVLSRIYPELNTKLQQLLETDNDILYINDKDFGLPGFIDEEIVRAVASCKCTIALVSRHFLESNWTHLEVSYSWHKKRPIVLVFLEDIGENELSGILKYLYNKNVRLVWPTVPGIQEEHFWNNLLRGLIHILKADETCTTIRYSRLEEETQARDQSMGI